MNDDPAGRGLEPALEVSSYLAAVKLAYVGDSVGYERRFSAERDTWIETIPIGYADGILLELTNNCDVLVDGTLSAGGHCQHGQPNRNSAGRRESCWV